MTIFGIMIPNFPKLSRIFSQLFWIFFLQNWSKSQIFRLKNFWFRQGLHCAEELHKLQWESGGRPVLQPEQQAAQRQVVQVHQTHRGGMPRAVLPHRPVQCVMWGMSVVTQSCIKIWKCPNLFVDDYRERKYQNWSHKWSKRQKILKILLDRYCPKKQFTVVHYQIFFWGFGFPKLRPIDPHCSWI